MSNDFGRTFVLAAALLAAPALAKAGCWDNCCNTWDEFKRACSCDGGDAYPNPPRCVPRGGGYVPPPVPVDPRILQNQRYQKVIEGASGIIDAAYFRGLPTATDAEFGRALGTLHQHLWRVAQVSSAGRALFAARSAEGAAFRRNFYEPMRRSLGPGGVARDISADNASARSELAVLQVETARFKDLHERLVRSGASATARRLHAEEALLAKQMFWAHFGGLSRQEVEEVTPAYNTSRPKLDPCCEETARPGHIIESQKPVAIAETAAVERAAEAYSTARIRIPQSLSGDNEARLAAVEKINAEALAAFTAEQAARNHYEKNWAPAHDQTLWENVLDTNRRVLDDTHRFASKLIPEAKAALKQAREFFDSEAWEVYKNGGKAITWHVFRKKMVEPEVKRLSIEFFQGRYLRTRAEILQAWKHDRSGLFDAYKESGRYKYTYEFHKTCARRIEGSFEESSLAMTDVYGHAEVSDVQEIGGRVLADLDGATREEVKKSVDRVDLPDAVFKNWRTHYHGRKW